MSNTTPDSSGWKPVTATEPPEGVPVMTRVNDLRGVRNEARLMRQSRLWFIPNVMIYVYYTPTEWREDHA